MHSFLNVEFKLTALGPKEFEGHGAIFGNRDFGGDRIERGAFYSTLKKWESKKKWPPMLWSHDPSEVPGVWTHMSEDSDGLLVRGSFVDTTRGRDTYVLAKSGAVTGLSIGYQVVKSDWEKDVRVLKEIDLWEISLVALPMNEFATIENVKAGPGNDAQSVLASIQALTDSLIREIVR